MNEPTIQMTENCLFKAHTDKMTSAIFCTGATMNIDRIMDLTLKNDGKVHKLVDLHNKLVEDMKRNKLELNTAQNTKQNIRQRQQHHHKTL